MSKNIINLGENCNIDLDILLETRMLVQANSGGGKSWLLRRLLEQSHGKVQQIILDLEGEFATLREKYDYLLIGKEGDIPINIKTAELLAKKLLELNISSIIDLYELKHHERITFVRRFLDSMINSPKELWHPVLVIVDEAHIFCPEKGESESMGSVIDLATRGRKRGFCIVIATQRLSKLHKDAGAECNNKLIGRTFLDIDMKRASDELGFTSKSQMLQLRELQAGEFFSFGSAMQQKGIGKTKVGLIKTTHPKAGLKRIIKPPVASSKIKSILQKITDLPKEAEIELKTVQDFKNEIHRLKLELRRKETIKPVDAESVSKVYDKGFKDGESRSIKIMESLRNSIDKVSFDLITDVHFNNKGLKNFTKRKAVFLHHLQDGIVLNTLSSSSNQPRQSTTMESPPIQFNKVIPTSPSEVISTDEKITGGAMRMLKAIAMYHPNPISKARMGTIAGLSYSSGTFQTYLGNLKRNNLIIQKENGFIATEEGLRLAGDVESLPTEPEELITMWVNAIGGGASRMLKVLAEAYPESLTKEDLGNRANISYSSGTFQTYIGILKRNGLIVKEGQNLKLSEEFHEG